MAKSDKEILRTVNVNGELYEPGMEDELEDALAELEEQDEEFSAEDELSRLAAKGYVVGFGDDPEEDDLEAGTPDQLVTRARRRAMVQELPKGKKARGGKKRGGTRRAPKVQPQNPDNPGTSTAPGDEAGDANTES